MERCTINSMNVLCTIYGTVIFLFNAVNFLMNKKKLSILVRVVCPNLIELEKEASKNYENYS